MQSASNHWFTQLINPPPPPAPPVYRIYKCLFIQQQHILHAQSSVFSPPRSNSPMPKPLTCSSHSERCHDWVAVPPKDYIEFIPEVAWNEIIAPLTCGNGVEHAFTHLSMPHLPPLPMWLGACDRLKPEGGGFLWPCLRHGKGNSRHPLFSTKSLGSLGICWAAALSPIPPPLTNLV